MPAEAVSEPILAFLLKSGTKWANPIRDNS